MAQKKGLIQRIVMGRDDLPDFTPDKLPGTRFQQFKDVFFGRMGAMVKISLLSLLFGLPIIAIIFLSYLTSTVDASMLGYSANYGIGYPVLTNVNEIASARSFWFTMQMYILLMPCVVVFFIGLSGAFYVMRRLVWGEGVGVTSHFFRGIKGNIGPFLFSSIFLSVAFSLVMININAYNQIDISPALKVIGLAISLIVFVLLLCMMIFLTTQAVTYKLNFWALVKNSFVLAIGLLPLNIIMLVLSALPVVLVIVLLPIQMIGTLFLMLFLMMGLAYIILLWTVYAHWVYDKFINPKIEGAVKNRGMYVPTEEEKKTKREREMLAKNVRFNNPKYIGREISSIDEGSTFTPLSATFSRADLERLAQEKEIVKNEIDAEYGDVEQIDKDEPTREKAQEKEKPQIIEPKPQKSAKASFKTKK